MNREEMLKELQSEKIRVGLTYTNDMGIEYSFIVPEGAGDILGQMGDWPVYKLEKIEETKWKEIQESVANSIVNWKTIEGTSLEHFLRFVYEKRKSIVSTNKLDNLNVVFQDLKNLPETLNEDFYCVFDALGFDERLNPRFYENEDLLIDGFKKQYCPESWITKWDEMSDEEIERWYEDSKVFIDSFPRYSH